MTQMEQIISAPQIKDNMKEAFLIAVTNPWNCFTSIQASFHAGPQYLQNKNVHFYMFVSCIQIILKQSETLKYQVF